MAKVSADVESSHSSMHLLPSLPFLVKNIEFSPEETTQFLRFTRFITPNHKVMERIVHTYLVLCMLLVPADDAACCWQSWITCFPSTARPSVRCRLCR